jgi:hypothetical protein|tara:strand:+ start:5553 stop:5831 length:279 start_codon:yes stop_codon:yes gene_type:complete
MKEKKEKIYLPSSIKNIETKFGSMMVANFKLDELQANSKNGWVSMVIAERREPSEKGATHYAYVNDYEPQQKENKTSPKKVKSTTGDDDLPF